ncbi:MAG: YwqG family protein [Acutalibacteraceae bacterium]
MNQAQQIYERLKEKTEQPVVAFNLFSSEEEKTTVLDSKIGGAFYVPENMTAPVDKETGKPLFLLAQINFAECPHLEDFPTEGLLQFFISGDDIYGCNFDDPTKQSSWRLRYIEKLPALEEIPQSCIVKPQWDENDDEAYLPFDADTEYRIYPMEAKQSISIEDHRFHFLLKEYCSDITNGVNYYDLPEETIDQLYDLLEPFGCQMGGYPTFTQSDPRSSDKFEVLLFQLDSVEDIMWGDSGVANFFISREALRAKDFSKVMYNWDCC